MNMDLKDGDYIVITGYNTDDFYQDQFYRHLINKPTKVWDLGNRGVHLTHPYLDMVPFSDGLKYEKIESNEDLPSHKELKSLTQNLDKIMGREGKGELKNLRVKKIKKRKLKETIIKVLHEEEGEKKKSRANEKLTKIIDNLNNREIDFSMVEKLFGSIERFVSLVKDRGLIDLIDPFNRDFEDIQNSLLHNFVQNDPDFVYTIATTLLNGITKVGDDYYYDADYSELADLFKTRDFGPRVIEYILSGEYDPYEYGSYDTDDEYRDVYDNLDHYAKSVVDEHIVNELKAMDTLKFSLYKRTPELFEEIAEEQGDEDKIKLTDEVIARLMTDKDSIRYLINLELDEVRSNLSSIYSTCYGDILSTQWYNDLWGELVGVVVDSKDGEDYSYQKSVWEKDGKRGTKTAYGRRYKVTNCLKDIIKGWLDVNQNKNGFNENTIEYFGNYISLIKDAMEYGPMDWLNVPRLDDYPDWREMNKCMSENVESYF